MIVSVINITEEYIDSMAPNSKAIANAMSIIKKNKRSDLINMFCADLPQGKSFIISNYVVNKKIFIFSLFLIYFYFILLAYNRVNGIIYTFY